MGEVTTVGLDLAKHVFQVHGIDEEGAVVLRKQLRRSQVLVFFGRLPRCLVGLEACATALRDVLLGLPVFCFAEPAYLITCALASAFVYFAAHIPQSRYRYLLWMDAIGLALFAVTGAEKAAQVGAQFTVAVAAGVITATFGGIIRDLLGGESPIILSREIYASAALAAAVVLIVLTAAGAPRELAVGFGFASGLLIRAAALRYGWSLPRYRQRSSHLCDQPPL